MRCVKRIVLLLLFCFCLFLQSCETETEEPYTKFVDYDQFESLLSSWQEPDTYSFTYQVCWGDSLVYYPITTTVTDGVAEIDYGDNLPDYDESEFTENSYLGDISFSSISELLTYYNNWWLTTKAETNNDYQITFSVTYKTTSDDVLYAEYLDESEVDITNSDDDGYGGLYIVIDKLVIG